MEIADGIRLIPRVRGSNVYLVKGVEGITVVDTGLPGSAGKIVDYVESTGWHHSDVKTIVLTHSDIDHAGSAARLREKTKAKVAVHEADAPRLSGEKQWKTVEGVFDLLFRAAGIVMRFNRLKADVLLKDSDVIDGLIVVHTPGHTEGSICLYLPGRALFVGDALVSNHRRVLSLPRRSMSVDLNLAKGSIKKISQLDYSVLLPGHGPPIEQDALAIAREFVTRI